MLTFVCLGIVVFTISTITVNYLFKQSKNWLINRQFEAGKREAREIAILLEAQLQLGTAQPTVVSNLQHSIENTDLSVGFICMYDTTGVEICHPNPSKIGKLVDKSSRVNDLTRPESLGFSELLNNGKAAGGIRTFGDANKESEIIYVYPVSGTGWMVAAHANTSLLSSQLHELKVKFILIQLASALLIILLSFIAVRWVNSRYEKYIETGNEMLLSNVLNLSKLNSDLVRNQQKLSFEINPETPSSKQRIVINWKDQLVPIPVKNIAFFYTENTLTYIYCNNNTVYNTTNNLEEFYEQINHNDFFRANRQFIISMGAINKIYRYGSNQLKLEMTPGSPEDIIISKNKVSEFKQWLNS